MANKWFDLAMEDRSSCQTAIRNGGVAALISAGLTAAFAVAGLFLSETGTAADYFLDPWMLVDVVLVVVLAIFVFRKSRIASTTLLVYFVISKIIMWIELGRAPGLFMTLVFAYFYANAMRGTYKWHSTFKLEPAGDSSPSAA